jgi:microcystin-dependent protein
LRAPNKRTALFDLRTENGGPAARRFFDLGANGMTLYKWSQTAAADANADSTINWAEGQAPSSVNDSARAMMAATAKYRDDIAGAIVTAGTSTAYTVSSFQVFDTLADLNGQMIAFTPHATNGATVTLSVDSLGAKPLRSAPNVELPAGVIIQGTPYTATYNNTDGAFYLRGLYGNPYNVPLLGGMDFWDTVAPNSSFIFPQGQAISRTAYAAAFARWGTTYGSGDGSTTFNVPDKTGRVSAMLEAVGTRLTTAGAGVDGGTLGSVGGNQNITIAQSGLPNIAPAFAGVNGSINVTSSGNFGHANGLVGGVNTGSGNAVAFDNSGVQSLVTSSGSFTPSGSVASINGNVMQTATKTVQPTIVCNYIIRIL